MFYKVKPRIVKMMVLQVACDGGRAEGTNS